MLLESATVSVLDSVKFFVNVSFHALSSAVEVDVSLSKPTPVDALSSAFNAFATFPSTDASPAMAMPVLTAVSVRVMFA